MIETAQNKFRKFFFRKRNTKNLLSYIQTSGDGTNAIYVYPNQEKADVVFVKNKLTERVKTKLR